jgi:Xaa-Pro aminopeptidase
MDIDSMVRETAASAGFDDACLLRMSGHGLGLELHEAPRLRQGVGEPLPIGAVVTVETGLWEEGRLSVFWEDDYVLCDTGAVGLSRGGEEQLRIC